MRRKSNNLISILIIALAFTGCTYRSSQPNSNKEQVVKKYSIESQFCHIDNQSPANIVFKQGDIAKVEAYGNEKDIAKLNILIKDSTLFISTMRKMFKLNSKTRLSIFITSPDLHSICQRGVGTITLKDSVKVSQLSIRSEGVGSITAHALQAQNLDVYQEGVGSIELKGQAENARFEQNGVGSLKAKKMVIADLSVEQNGVGSVDCFASRTIRISSQGVGSINYYGTPQVIGLKKTKTGSVHHKHQ